ncbi:DUF6130 family protein [Sphingomonas sp.]|uniref:DUF6130 family protein n=1 Tax=Sphingomonas sp. TaxID=28214 RepID=UPI003D6D0569
MISTNDLLPLPGAASSPFRFATLIGGAIALFSATVAPAQSARDILGPAGVVPLTAPQPPARIIVDPPLAGPLAEGKVFIQYRAENLRIVPVFGPAALSVTPRIGHVHVSVDNAPWHWADASGDPLILVGLPAGRHKVELILANANHQPLDRAVVEFTVPATGAATAHH